MNSAGAIYSTRLSKFITRHFDKVAAASCFVGPQGGCRLVSYAAAPAAIAPTIRRRQRETGSPLVSRRTPPQFMAV